MPMIASTRGCKPMDSTGRHQKVSRPVRGSTTLAKAGYRSIATATATSRWQSPCGVSGTDGLRAESTHSRAVGRRWQAQCAGRDRDDGHRVAGHVEELDGVPLVRDTRHDVTIDERANIPSTQAAFGDVAGEDHVAIGFEGHPLPRVHSRIAWDLPWQD